MTPFEEELRKALVRAEPTEDFTERVLAAAHSDESRSTKNGWLTPGFWRFASVAALVIVLFAAAFGYRQHVRRVKGEAAKEQLLTALHIAGAQLHAAQMRVHDIENSEVMQ